MEALIFVLTLLTVFLKFANIGKKELNEKEKLSCL